MLDLSLKKYFLKTFWEVVKCWSQEFSPITHNDYNSFPNIIIFQLLKMKAENFECNSKDVG